MQASLLSKSGSCSGRQCCLIIFVLKWPWSGKRVAGIGITAVDDVRNLLLFVVKIVGGRGYVYKIGVVDYATQAGKKINANAFDYPNEYPICMTDWSMYAIFLACKHGLTLALLLTLANSTQSNSKASKMEDTFQNHQNGNLILKHVKLKYEQRVLGCQQIIRTHF